MEAVPISSKEQKLLSGDNQYTPVLLELSQHQFDTHSIELITKLKAKQVANAPQAVVFKVNLNDKQHFYCVQDLEKWISSLLWAKMKFQGVSALFQEEFINVCSGVIYKKSAILGQWEERYVMITVKDGLMSHRNKNQGPTMTLETIKEFWTRFETIEENQYLVLKTKNNFFKMEWAVPVYNCIKWTRAFLSLLK